MERREGGESKSKVLCSVSLGTNVTWGIQTLRGAKRRGSDRQKRLIAFTNSLVYARAGWRRHPPLAKPLKEHICFPVACAGWVKGDVCSWCSRTEMRVASGSKAVFVLRSITNLSPQPVKILFHKRLVVERLNPQDNWHRAFHHQTV